MRFKIGYRTIKTALGMTISIMLAQLLGLHNFASAGILTVLCIKVTKLKSIRASWDRILACIIAMIFSSVFFELFGYHPVVIGLMILFFIPTVVMFRASEGIVSSTVIIIHLFMARHVTLDLLVNELGIIFIGIGVALIMNLYIPSLDNKLKDHQRKIEQNFKKIFDEIVLYLRTHDSSWGGREITETSKLIDEARQLAFLDIENHFLRNENFYYQYFKMRDKQFEIIERVLPIVTSLSLEVEQAKMIADFLEELSEHIHPGNTAIIYLDKIQRMRVEFQNMDLPVTREEFETRAALLHFVGEMEEYLIIKSNFYRIDHDKKGKLKAILGL
ncbi:aromatic acid exporter family protein [Cytobacillus sp. Hz8]|uniref:aromatic acid exporter family protein n=1 Tax=Cytobacillus sp. Hz8 TaxID=3347168 RepID=UPI0035D630E2